MYTHIHRIKPSAVYKILSNNSNRHLKYKIFLTTIDNWYIEEQINNIDNYGINIIGGNGNSLLYDISQFRNIDSKQIVNSNVNTPRCIVPNLTASLLKGNHTIKTLVYAHPQNKTLSNIQDIIKQFK